MPKSIKRAVIEGLTSEPARQPVRRQGRPTENIPDWAPAFIEALMTGLSVKDATAKAGVHFTMPFKRRKKDEAFRQAWNEAADIGTRLLEQEAARRAYHGTEKPVYYKGEQVGTVREYSDILLMFLLKGRKPEKYRERSDGGGSKQPVAINITINDVPSPQITAIEVPNESAEVKSEVEPPATLKGITVKNGDQADADAND